MLKNGSVNWHAVEEVASNSVSLGGDDGIIGATAPDLIKLLVELRSGLRVDNEAGFRILALDDFLEIVSDYIAAEIAGDDNDFEVFGWIAVISRKKLSFGFLEFWFQTGFLTILRHIKLVYHF